MSRLYRFGASTVGPYNETPLYFVRPSFMPLFLTRPTVAATAADLAVSAGSIAPSDQPNSVFRSFLKASLSKRKALIDQRRGLNFGAAFFQSHSKLGHKSARKREDNGTEGSY